MTPIPRILHQVWLGPNPLPEEFARYRETWREHHPGWTLELWTDENLPDDLRRPEVYERLRVPAERADILRLEVLWRFGGVYVDTDFECRQPLDPLIEGADFFTAYLKPGRVNNAIIGATPEHPILDRALRELSPTDSYGYDKAAAGPLFLDRLVKDYSEIRIFEPEAFYPSTPGEREHAVAIHHTARSWKDADGFRQAARRAEERTARVNVDLAKLRRHRDSRLEALAETQRRLELAQAGERFDPPLSIRLAQGVAERVPRIVRAAFCAAVPPAVRRAPRRAMRVARRRLAPAAVRHDDSPALTARPAAASRSEALRIPRVVHHVWLAPAPPPSDVARARESWRRCHPGWEHRVWTDDDLPEDLRRDEIRQLLRPPEERSRLLRLELLRLYGGISPDHDLKCRRSLEPLLGDREFAAGATPDGCADDGLLAAVAGHPLLEELLDAYPSIDDWGERPAHVADLLTPDRLAAHGGASLLPPEAIADRHAAGDEAWAVRIHRRETDDPREEALEAERVLAETHAAVDATTREIAVIEEQRQTADAELDAIRAACGSRLLRLSRALRPRETGE